MQPFAYHTVFVALADTSGALLPFYCQLLGRSPDSEIAGVYAEFQLAGLRLGIFRPQANHAFEFEAQSSGSFSLCFEVPHLEAAIDRLRAIGLPPPGKIMIASHGREIYAYDPSGNRLILHESSSELREN